MPDARPRLVQALPDVFIGADAATALDGRRGFLYGEKRHRQVDILGFEPTREGADAKDSTFAELVERRLGRTAIRGWRIVGLAVRPEDLEGHEATLLRGLVAGDVVAAVARVSRGRHDGGADVDIRGGKTGAAALAAGSGFPHGELRILVHRGDCLADLRTTTLGTSGLGVPTPNRDRRFSR